MFDEYKYSPRKLSELIEDGTTEEQFEKIVAQLLPPDAENSLGPGAKDKLRNALLDVTVMGLNKFFDEKALSVVLAIQDEKEFNIILKILKEIGVIEVDDQYIGPTPEEDKEDEKSLQQMGLKLSPRPRSTFKDRLHITDSNLFEKLSKMSDQFN
jgi:hypothetical protein